MKIYSLSLAAIVMATFGACSANKGVPGNRVVPDGEYITYDVQAKDVNSINVSSAIEVQYTQSETVSVKVDCPENIAEMLEVTVKNGLLVAGFKPNTTIDGNCRVTVTVTSPGLTSIDASSSSQFGMTGALVQNGPLSVEASSSARVNLCNLSVSRLDVDNSSSSSVEVSGVKADSLDIECSSSASAGVSDIRCQNVEADASSTATITLSGVTVTAEYEASSTAIIDAEALRAETVVSAAASSTATISCSADNYKAITEKSGGTVSCEK